MFVPLLKNTKISEDYANQIMREGSDDNTLITQTGGTYGPFKAVFGNKMSNIHVYQKLVNDYDTQKRKHLEKLATKSLENDEKFRKFHSKHIKGDYLDLF